MGFSKKYLVTTTHPPPTSKMLLAVRFSKKSIRDDIKATYLAVECRNRLENLTNRKQLSIFYIETMSQLFFQLRYFFSRSKMFSGFFSVKIFFRWFSPKIENCLLFFFKYFQENSRKIFLTEKNQKNIFDAEKKNRSWKKSWDIISM